MKWSKLDADESLADLGKIEVLITIEEGDFEDIEVLQSAEIIYRDLLARGLEVVFDDRAPFTLREEEIDRTIETLDIPLRIEISAFGLKNGGWVKLFDRQADLVHKLPLEEAVERAEELTHGLGL